MQRLLLLLLAVTSSLHGQAFLPARLLPKASQAVVSSVVQDNGKLWAVGDHGHFFHYSGDWEQEPFPAQQFLTDLAVQDDKTWVVGHDAIIVHRESPGAEWTIQHFAPELESPLFRVHFKDTNIGMAVGAYGLVLLTENGGQDWRRIEVSEEEPHFYWVTTDNEGSWYLAGEFGYVVKLGPSGEVIKRYDTGYTSSFFGVEVLGPDVWMAYGLRGRMVFHNGKETFRVENPLTSGLFGSLSLDDRVLFFGDAGTILAFTDEHELKNVSLPYRTPILTAAVYGGHLILGTASGMTSISLAEVLQ